MPTSKVTVLINAVEFIAFFGDFFPKSNDKSAQYPSVVVAVEDIKELEELGHKRPFN